MKMQCRFNPMVRRKARPHLHIFMYSLLLLAWLVVSGSTVQATPVVQENPAEDVNLFSKVLTMPLVEYEMTEQCRPLYNEADALYHQSHYIQALEIYQLALECYRSANNLAGESTVLSDMGLIYANQGRYQQALDYYQEALSISQEIEDRWSAGNILNSIGEVFRLQGYYTTALDYYHQALEIVPESDASDLIGAIFGNIGLVYHQQGNYSKALEYYERALMLHRESGNRWSESIVLNNIGGVHWKRGNFEEALNYYQQAFTLYQEVGELYSQGITLNNIGGIYWKQGKYKEALNYYQQALTIHRKTDNRREEGITLDNIGLIYRDQSHYSDALIYHEQALRILIEIGAQHETGATLGRIGLIYSYQGRYDKALEYQRLSLKVSSEAGDKEGESRALNNISTIYRIQGQNIEALECLQEAQIITHQIGDRVAEAGIFNNIGTVYADQKLYHEAMEAYLQALSIYRDLSDRAGQSITLNNIGSVYVEERHYIEALDNYQQALLLARELGNRTDEGSILSNIGYAYHKQRRYDEALNYSTQAVDILESVRSTAGSEEGRASFISQYAMLYDVAVTLFQQQGQDKKAFYTSERGRARAFLDSLATGQVQLTDNEATQLLEREQALYGERQATQDALARARAADPSDANLIADLEAQLAQLEADYTTVQEEIAGRSAALAALVPGRSAVPELEEIQAAMDTDTTLLAYWVTEEQTFAFVVTRNALEVVELNVSHDDLLTQVRALRSFANVSEAHPAAVVTLHEMLIAPLNEHLTTPHLAIVPHDVLHYLPFAALSDGERFLVDEYTLTLLPSAGSLLHIQQNSGNALTNPLVLGNPAHPDQSSLAAAEDEAITIAGMFDSTPFLGNTATEAAVRAGSTGAGILHIAAHGTFNQAAPLESALFLTPAGDDDGQLTVREIYSLNLQRADLVVLSACETQIDDTGIMHGQLSVDAGDELVGLTRAFFYAGTPSVVSTLWSVDDEPSAMLMERFYTHLYNGMGKAAALRQAQMDVRNQYPNPYYWAGYVLSGDAGRSGNQGATPGHPNAHDTHTAAPDSGVGAYVQGLLPWFLACLGLLFVLVVVVAGLIARRRVARS